MSEADVRATPSLAPQTGPGDWLSLPCFTLALGLLLFVAFPEVWLGGRSFFTRDFSTFGHPIASYVQHSYRAGELPLWNPYSFTGLPFLAQWWGRREQVPPVSDQVRSRIKVAFRDRKTAVGSLIES